jgi:hypothetical protein
MEQAPVCVYCRLPVNVQGDEDFILLTDSKDWVGHAHCECQKIAEALDRVHRQNINVSAKRHVV